MCRKVYSLTVVTALILLLTLTVQGNAAAQTNSFGGVTVSTASDQAQGEVTLTGINETGKTLKIWARKGQTVGRWYDVGVGREFNETLKLLEGTGVYDIYVMILVEGSRYTYGPSLRVDNSIQETAASIEVTEHKDINSGDKDIAGLARQLTADRKTDREKIEAISGWIIKNLTYDYEKYSNIVRKDFSDQYGASVALETRKGVCYDYATLFTALCRAEGIQSKVAKGYSTNIIGYHAWNEVYDTETEEWLILDLSVDSIRYHKKGIMTGLNIRSEEEYYKTEEM